jgi:DNA polymerase-4
MNGFFASVELLDHPELRNRPMAVCGNPKNRHGIIVAKNELAKKAGVKTAETIWQARKKCPDLQVVAPHHEKYQYYSRLINEIYYQYTDLVEPFSIDESWLDVTHSQKLLGSGKEIADQIRETIKSQLNLTLSVGVSFNKIFAKMGSEYKKPDATTEITRENYKDILWPLPVGELFFVGQSMAERLCKIGIVTIGDLAVTPSETLSSMFGKHGVLVWEYANGKEAEPVTFALHRKKIKSVGNGITFRRDLLTQKDIDIAVAGLSDTVASRLRQYQMKAAGIRVEIKDPEFHSIRRQTQLESPTNLAHEIARISKELIQSTKNSHRPIRLLTITGIQLVDESMSQQISLFPEQEQLRNEIERLERTLDQIREKYGTGSVHYGSLLHNDLGLDLEEIKEED